MAVIPKFSVILSQLNPIYILTTNCPTMYLAICSLVFKEATSWKLKKKCSSCFCIHAACPAHHGGALRRIFGPKREEDRSCRKLHNDELHSLYSSPNMVRVIKSRRLRWA
jgi:hypothetical protein